MCVCVCVRAWQSWSRASEQEEEMLRIMGWVVLPLGASPTTCWRFLSPLGPCSPSTPRSPFSPWLQTPSVPGRPGSPGGPGGPRLPAAPVRPEGPGRPQGPVGPFSPAQPEKATRGGQLSVDEWFWFWFWCGHTAPHRAFRTHQVNPSCPQIPEVRFQELPAEKTVMRRG